MDRGRILITGGAGFIGVNVAHRCLSRGQAVLIYDNLPRSGSERNLRWLQRLHGKRVRVAIEDVRDPGALRRAVRQADRVFHFAAQVAVTRSLTDPAQESRPSPHISRLQPRFRTSGR